MCIELTLLYNWLHNIEPAYSAYLRRPRTGMKVSNGKNINMSSFSEYIVLLGLLLVNISVFMLRNVLLIVQYLSHTFPRASDLATTGLLIYLFYKILRRLFTMWIKLLTSIVKFTFFLILFFVVSTIYIRGANVFFTKDVHFIFNVCQNIFSGNFSVRDFISNRLFQGANENTGSFADVAQNWIHNYPMYQEQLQHQMQNMRGDLEGFLGQNIDALQGFLESRDLDAPFDDVLNYLRFN